VRLRAAEVLSADSVAPSETLPSPAARVYIMLATVPWDWPSPRVNGLSSTAIWYWQLPAMVWEPPAVGRVQRGAIPIVWNACDTAVVSLSGAVPAVCDDAARP
jgi:hypothetical protein